MNKELVSKKILELAGDLPIVMARYPRIVFPLTKQKRVEIVAEDSKIDIFEIEHGWSLSNPIEQVTLAAEKTVTLEDGTTIDYAIRDTDELRIFIAWVDGLPENWKPEA